MTDHCSDDEEEQDSPSRQRSRSYSDAEDFINGVGYYESIIVDGSSKSPSGLHHRSRTQKTNARATARLEDDKFSKLKQTFRRNTKYSKRPNVIKFCLFAGFGSYLLFHSYWLLRSSRVSETREGGQPPLVRPSIWKASTTQSSWDQKDRLDLLREAQLQIERRSAKRRQRTRPAETISGNIPWYQMQRETVASRRQLEEIPQIATLDDLCGFHAQNASLTHPEWYPSQTALNTKARVLITGILNPLGFSLALHLTEQCGVKFIGGIDNMYPNTVFNRLQLLERMEILKTKIPDMGGQILLPFVGLNPKSKETIKGEDDVVSRFKPTHIVHLSSYAQDVYSSALVDPEWKNTHSPYTDATRQDPPLYQLRSSMVSMEQILQSLASSDDPPQFIYATSSISTESNNIHATTKRIDEILANTYHAISGIPSIGLELPNGIYGPWGQAGSPIHDLVESAVEQWNSTELNWDHLRTAEPALNLMYVDDAVDAIVAALQCKASHPAIVQVTSGTETSLASVASVIESLLPNWSNRSLFETKGTPSLENKSYQKLDAPSIFAWSPRTSLQDGLIKTVAWHLDRFSPYGPPLVESGDTFLKRQSKPTCAAEDLSCHKNKKYLPCLSECNTRDQCLPSIFDEVKDLVHNVTEGCDVVLYTQSLGYNVQELKLEAEFMDDNEIANDDDLLCNFAFIPRDSDLVTNVTTKVPNDELAQFGIKPEQSDNGKTMRERKLDGLNGRLLYKGWVLIWVKDAIEPLSVTDRSLLKLSPGKLFPPAVHSALYVEEHFSVSPSIEDVQFLVAEMRRGALRERIVKGTLREMKDGVEMKTTKKFRLPEEPKRRALMLFAPLRFPNVDDLVIQQFRNGHKKLSTLYATKFMRYETLGVNYFDKEPKDIRKQREFYERIPYYINKNTELRSRFEPWYRYSMRHWVRTRWVVHDMELEDSRLLRCDWYQEHTQWGTDLDQLSFAHVMASRELKRRMNHNEPDDHIKTFIEQHPYLRALTDSYEWHPMETEHNKMYREPTTWMSQLPDHLPKIQDDHEAVEEVDDEEDPNKPVPLYVRIVSDRMMQVSREAWLKNRKKK